ncbi:MAG: glycosyltransferase family 4 protein [Candidatus Edwardsbacteria bacterium]
MKILFVHKGLSTFVASDLKILQKRYKVKDVSVKNRFINIPMAFLDVARSDLIFAWFASWHSLFYILFPKLLRKYSIVVAGGYDVANMPEIDYGLIRRGIKKIIGKSILRLSDAVLCFSQFSKEEASRNAGVSEEKVHLVYLGVESENVEKDLIKENMVITVGNINFSNLKRKGMESFVYAAGFIPDIPFVLIGKWEDKAIDYLKSVASPNVVFPGFIPADELRKYMQRAKVYVQVSAHEGFGLALAEAMLYECIPVVTKIGALPEIVGDVGLYTSSADPKVVAEKIGTALTLENDLGKKARERIVQRFPLKRREEEIFRFINNLMRLQI